MRFFSVHIFRMRGKTPIKLACASDLSSFSYWWRSTYREFFAFASRLGTEKTAPGSRQTIEQKQTQDPDTVYKVHVYVRLDGLAATAVTDEEYPIRVAFSFLNKVLSDFEQQSGETWKEMEVDMGEEKTPPFLPKILTEFQDPKAADKLLQIQDKLDDIKEIMHRNIEEVLKRGETIDVLVQKSQDISENSKFFYQKARKQNQCCKAW